MEYYYFRSFGKYPKEIRPNNGTHAPVLELTMPKNKREINWAILFLWSTNDKSFACGSFVTAWTIFVLPFFYFVCTALGGVYVLQNVVLSFFCSEWYFFGIYDLILLYFYIILLILLYIIIVYYACCLFTTQHAGKIKCSLHESSQKWKKKKFKKEYNSNDGFLGWLFEIRQKLEFWK
jgi:hypothetical protein